MELKLKQKIKHILAILTVMNIATSCNKTTPAGFWTNFQNNHIKENNSNQGPWGGHTEVFWKGDTQNTFSDFKLIEYAQKNNWKLVDSISFSVDSIADNDFTKLKIDDYSLTILKKNIQLNAASNDYKVFIFKTNWLAVEPGNARETFENGFAIINSNGTELSIYHLWGE